MVDKTSDVKYKCNSMLSRDVRRVFCSGNKIEESPCMFVLLKFSFSVLTIFCRMCGLLNIIPEELSENLLKSCEMKV